MLKIVDGDIFESDADIIAHQVNCQGVMGSGVAKQVREKFPYVYEYYKSACSEPHANLLGECMMVPTDPLLCEQWIANLFGQDKFGYDGKCYTDYGKLREALRSLNRFAKGGKPTSVAIPYLMGCHRGGGDWEIVSKMIEEELTDCDVTLYRYTGG